MTNRPLPSGSLIQAQLGSGFSDDFLFSVCKKRGGYIMGFAENKIKICCVVVHSQTKPFFVFSFNFLFLIIFYKNFYKISNECGRRWIHAITQIETRSTDRRAFTLPLPQALLFLLLLFRKRDTAYFLNFLPSLVLPCRDNILFALDPFVFLSFYCIL